MNRDPELPHAQGDTYLTIPDLAELLGVNAEHLYRLARRNEIPGLVRLGKSVRVNYTRFVSGTP